MMRKKDNGQKENEEGNNAEVVMKKFYRKMLFTVIKMSVFLKRIVNSLDREIINFLKRG